MTMPTITPKDEEMNDLILDPTIVYAGLLDFWPTQNKGHGAVPACLDLSLSGLLRLTHAPMQDWVLVTPEFIRIAVPGIVNMDHFHRGLAVGGALRTALVGLRCAAIADRGILTASGEVRHELQGLSEGPSSRGADRGEIDYDDPVLQPYGGWFYGIERNSGETDGKPRVLGLPIPRVNQARQRNPDLAIYSSDDLLEDGLSPVTAEIGIPRHDADYAAARSEWIEIAIESLVANIEEAVKGWPILPGEPFQNVVLIEGDMFFITVDTVDGVTVASPTASEQALEQLTLEVHRVGHSHLVHGLAMLRRAVV